MKHLITRYFTFEKKLHYGSVGIVFNYGKLFLLVHPTGFKHNNWSYPKGRVESGEDWNEAAIREFQEETGVKLPKNFLDNKKLYELNPVEKQSGIKHYWYYKHSLTHEEFETYFNSEFVIPKENLQIEEIDEARFIEIETAKKLISGKFLETLL